MNTVVIGLGLIGGSLALDLRSSGLVRRVIGVDNNPAHRETALRRGLVDEVMELHEALASAEMVVIAIPVDQTAALLPTILDRIPSKAVVTDVGSVKSAICRVIQSHPKCGRFVAAHPIAGTEYSGPDAAFQGLFRNKVCIICNAEQSDRDALLAARQLFERLGMRLLSMEASEHDRHAAFVSHLSHISSFVLATTVLEIEKSSSTIFDLAGSGFASTVRLAKSSPDMWAPIFTENATHLHAALTAYLKNLKRFQQLVADGDTDALRATMNQGNRIGRVLAGLNETETKVVKKERVI